MYIGPERHRRGLWQNGGNSHYLGVFPKYTQAQTRHGLWQKTGGLSKAESFPKSLSGLLVERIFLESLKHKNPGVNQKYLSYREFSGNSSLDQGIRPIPPLQNGVYKGAFSQSKAVFLEAQPHHHTGLSKDRTRNP